MTLAHVLKLLFLIGLFYTIIKCDDQCESYKSNYSVWPNLKKVNENEIKQICAKKTCLTKCCNGTRVHYNAQDTTLLKPGCKQIEAIRTVTNYSVDKHTKFDYSELSEHFYKIGYRRLEKDNLKIDNFTVYYASKFLSHIVDCTTSLPDLGDSEETFYLTKDGEMYIEKPNRYVRYHIPSDDFCFEYLVEYFNEEEEKRVNVKIHLMRYNPYSNSKSQESAEFFVPMKMAASIISSICLVLVLFVYGSLPELWTVGRKTQMAYCATYLTSQIITVINHYSFDLGNCMYPSVVIYYFMFSSNFWMNAVSIEVWRRFRGKGNRNIRLTGTRRRFFERGDRGELIWYALYAWGTPILVTVIVYLIDQADLEDYPHIMKPFFKDCQSCGTVEMNFFYNIPVGILQLANILIFVSISVHIWRAKSNFGTHKFKDSGMTKNNSTFSSLVKLSLYTGMSWVLDVIYVLPDWLDKIAVIINSLTGVVIFFIFCFQKKYFVKLCKRYGLIERYEFARKVERKWSTSTATATTTSQSGRKQSATGSEASRAEIVSANIVSKHP